MNAFIDHNGILVSFGYMEADNDNDMVEVSDDFAMAPGFAKYNGEWVEYSPPVDYKSINLPIKDGLMSSAILATQGMSDAFIAGLLSDSEIVTFKTWAAYKLALSKVDLSAKKPTWPTVPTT